MFLNRCSVLGPLLRPARHRPNPARAKIPTRTTSTVGDNKNGFLNLAGDEGLLCFTNLLPIQRTRFLTSICHGISGFNIHEKMEKACIPETLKLKDSASSEAAETELRVLNIFPRPKDGAVFVQYRPKSREKMIESAISRHLKVNPVYRWFHWRRRVKVFAVRGQPWLEEMRRFPTKTLRVEFTGGEGHLTEQALYALFRRYGKIAEITAPQPTDIRKIAVVKFMKADGASAAKNCLDGHTLEEMDIVYGKEKGVRLRIWYQKTPKIKFIRGLMNDHPRYMIPLLVIIAVTIIIKIFDPIRAFSVEARLTGFPSVGILKMVKRFATIFYQSYRSEACATIGNPEFLNWIFQKSLDEEMKALTRAGTRSEEDELKDFLEEKAESYIVIQGPAIGKRKQIVDKVLTNSNKHTLYIDCKPIAAALDEGAVVKAFAAQIGYRPMFSTLNWVVDLLALFGNNSAGRFQKPFETQINEILQTTEKVLKKVALRDKRKGKKGYELSDNKYLHDNPRKRPVVVIDNFMPQEGIIYKKLFERAVQLAAESHAHIIFLTEDNSFAKAPGGRAIFLNDTPDDSPEVDGSYSRLPSEILRTYVLPDSRLKPSKTTTPWTPEQAWQLIQGLATQDSLPYDKVMLSDLFRIGGSDAGEGAVRELEQQGMISIVEDNARPATIKPGRRGHREAFKTLVQDKQLMARMELQRLKTLVAKEGRTIGKSVEELERLAVLQKRPEGRESYLLRKAGEAQKRIEEYEREMKRWERVLAE